MSLAVGDSRPTAEEQPIGWRVLDPDGNVVASGPCIELEMATSMGEEDTDGSDR